jgi:hypothetical protein
MKMSLWVIQCVFILTLIASVLVVSNEALTSESVSRWAGTYVALDSATDGASAPRLSFQFKGVKDMTYYNTTDTLYIVDYEGGQILKVESASQTETSDITLHLGNWTSLTDASEQIDSESGGPAFYHPTGFVIDFDNDGAEYVASTNVIWRNYDGVCNISLGNVTDGTWGGPPITLSPSSNIMIYISVIWFGESSFKLVVTDSAGAISGIPLESLGIYPTKLTITPLVDSTFHVYFCDNNHTVYDIYLGGDVSLQAITTQDDCNSIDVTTNSTCKVVAVKVKDDVLYFSDNCAVRSYNTTSQEWQLVVGSVNECAENDAFIEGDASTARFGEIQSIEFMGDNIMLIAQASGIAIYYMSNITVSSEFSFGSSLESLIPSNSFSNDFDSSSIPVESSEQQYSSFVESTNFPIYSSVLQESSEIPEMSSSTTSESSFAKFSTSTHISSNIVQSSDISEISSSTLRSNPTSSSDTVFSSIETSSSEISSESSFAKFSTSTHISSSIVQSSGISEISSSTLRSNPTSSSDIVFSSIQTSSGEISSESSLESSSISTQSSEKSDMSTSETESSSADMSSYVPVVSTGQWSSNQEESSDTESSSSINVALSSEYQVESSNSFFSSGDVQSSSSVINSGTIPDLSSDTSDQTGETTDSNQHLSSASSYISSNIIQSSGITSIIDVSSSVFESFDYSSDIASISQATSSESIESSVSAGSSDTFGSSIFVSESSMVSDYSSNIVSRSSESSYDSSNIYQTQTDVSSEILESSDLSPNDSSDVLQESSNTLTKSSDIVTSSDGFTSNSGTQESSESVESTGEQDSSSFLPVESSNFLQSESSLSATSSYIPHESSKLLQDSSTIVSSSTISMESSDNGLSSSNIIAESTDTMFMSSNTPEESSVGTSNDNQVSSIPVGSSNIVGSSELTTASSIQISSSIVDISIETSSEFPVESSSAIYISSGKFEASTSTSDDSKSSSDNNIDSSSTIFCYGVEESDSKVCSGHGSCHGTDQCTCDDSYIGTNCSIFCDSSICVTEYSSSFTFSGQGSIIGIFHSAARLANYVPCSNILETVTLAKVGIGANCRWRYDNHTDATVLEVLFGYQATLVAGDIMLLNRMFLVPNHSAIYVEVGTIDPPTSWLLKPVAKITAPTQLSSCADLVLDGRSSISYDGKDLSYTWNCTSGQNMDAINDYLLSHETSVVTVPSSLIPKNAEYTFTLTVDSFYKVKSFVTPKVVIKLDRSIPSYSLSGAGAYAITDAFRLISTVNSGSGNCNVDVSQFKYNWIQVSGPSQLPMSIQYNNTVVIFKNGAISVPGDYQFMFTISDSTEVIASDTIVVTIVLPNLISTSSGGTKLVQTTSQNTLQANCYDPAKTAEIIVYEWYEKNDGKLLSKTKSLVLPANSYTPDTYAFVVNCSKGSRKTQTSFTVIFSNEVDLPNVNIIPYTLIINGMINANSPLKLLGTVSGHPAGDGKWTVTTIDSDETSAVLGKNSATRAMSIAAGTLEAGETYIFTYTYSVNGHTGYASLTLTVNIPPQPGLLFITPEAGTSTETLFTISLPHWKDDQTPLSYTFSYLNSHNVLQQLFSTKTTGTFSTKFLPAGYIDKELVIIGTVTDSYGASFQVQKTITVNSVQNKTESILSNLSDLQLQISNGQVQNALNLIAVTSDMTNDDTISVAEKSAMKQQLLDSLVALLSDDDILLQVPTLIGIANAASGTPESLTGGTQVNMLTSLRILIQQLEQNELISTYQDIADTMSNILLAKSFGNITSEQNFIISASTLENSLALAGKILSESIENEIVNLITSTFTMSCSSPEQTLNGTRVGSATENAGAIISDELYELFPNVDFMSFALQVIFDDITVRKSNGNRRRLETVTGSKLVSISDELPVQISNSVVLLSLFVSGVHYINVSIETELLIEIPYPSIILLSQYFESNTTDTLQLECVQYNSENKWVSDSCRVLSINDDSVVCACHQLGLTKVQTTVLPSLTPNKHSSLWNGNLTTILFAIISGALFLLLTGLAYNSYFIGFWKKLDTSETYSRSKIWHHLLYNHLYISALLPSTSQYGHFTRVERVWVIFLTWFSIMGWNALFYGKVYHIFVIASSAITLGCTIVLQIISRTIFELTESFIKIQKPEDFGLKEKEHSILIKILLRRPILWKWISIFNYIGILIVMALAITSQIFYGIWFTKFEAGMWVLAIFINFAFDFVLVQPLYAILQTVLCLVFHEDPEMIPQVSYESNKDFARELVNITVSNVSVEISQEVESVDISDVKTTITEDEHHRLEPVVISTSTPTDRPSDLNVQN